MSMDNQQLILEHLVDIKAGQADLAARMTGLEKVVAGDGQPGLVQKVEALEASKNRVWGVGAAVTFIGGVLEYFLHRGK